jgi:bile acid-coenzyme A ligase
MKRMLEPARLHPESVRSIQAILHTGAVCPPWLKQAWIDLIGGERIFEMFGSTEGMGLTAIRGDEWLAHRGSVGRPWRSTIKILGPDQEELPPLEVGEIYGLPIDGAAHFAYVGIERTRITPDGHMSVGDLGWLDDEGFLFVADRRQDVIISGGINIYPAEVEGVMLEQAGVEDVVVVGRADEEWGRRVHAIVQTSAGDGPTIDEMRTYCRAHLSSEKVPKTFEIVERLPRDEAGKVRRSAL